MQSESYERPTRLGPGERIDPATGQVLYSAAWLSDPRVILEPPARVYPVRVTLSIAPAPGDEEAEPVSMLAGELRVAASSESRALERAARLLGFQAGSSVER